jgi:polyhydroxyalkanoate synthesis repressor PhaR
MPPKKILIKKYENRRLYDLTNKRYINLDEIAELVRESNEVTVVDAVTGEDLTRLILAQIVVENAKTPGSVFPVEILRQMIVVSGQATQESAVKYTKMMVEMYQNAFRSMPAALNPFNLVPQMPWMPKAGSPDGEEAPSVPQQQAEPVEQPAQQPAPSAEASSEVEALRRRVEQLEAQTQRSAKSAKAKPRQSKR